jgi:hypothetical protein
MKRPLPETSETPRSTKKTRRVDQRQGKQALQDISWPPHFDSVCSMNESRVAVLILVQAVLRLYCPYKKVLLLIVFCISLGFQGEIAQSASDALQHTNLFHEGFEHSPRFCGLQETNCDDFRINKIFRGTSVEAASGQMQTDTNP